MSELPLGQLANGGDLVGEFRSKKLDAITPRNIPMSITHIDFFATSHGSKEDVRPELIDAIRGNDVLSVEYLGWMEHAVAELQAISDGNAVVYDKAKANFLEKEKIFRAAGKHTEFGDNYFGSFGSYFASALVDVIFGTRTAILCHDLPGTHALFDRHMTANFSTQLLDALATSAHPNVAVEKSVQFAKSMMNLFYQRDKLTAKQLLADSPDGSRSATVFVGGVHNLLALTTAQALRDQHGENAEFRLAIELGAEHSSNAYERYILGEDLNRDELLHWLHFVHPTFWMQLKAATGEYPLPLEEVEGGIRTLHAKLQGLSRTKQSIDLADIKKRVTDMTSTLDL